MPGGPSRSIAFRFHPRAVDLVLAGGASGPIPFRVLLDGAAPGPAHGADGTGELREGRLYQFSRGRDVVREQTPEARFRKHGAQGKRSNSGDFVR